MDCLLLQQIEGLLGCQGGVCLLGVFRQREGCRQGQVATGGADAEGVLAGLGKPLRAGLVEGGEVAGLQGHGECLTLAGLQLTGLGEGFQLLDGLLETALGGCHVDLCHLLATDLAGVLDGDADVHQAGAALHHGLGELEGGVAESEAEGIGYFLLEGVEVAIAHVDVFLVVGIGVSGDGHVVGCHHLEGVEVNVAGEVPGGVVV